MEIIDFNSEEFKGFRQGEDILVDSSILLALSSIHDPWHETVKELFEKHIYSDESIVLLYINPIIVNEVMHLSTRSLVNFSEQFKIEFSKEEFDELRKFTETMLTILIDQDVLKILDGDVVSVRQQIKFSEKLGAADAGNVSIANLYGTNVLTVDYKLVKNMEEISNEINNVQYAYFTNPVYKTY